MTPQDPDLRELLHEHVADVSATDLTTRAWARGRAVRRRRGVGVVVAAGVAVAAVAVGLTMVGGDQEVRPSGPYVTTSSPSPIPPSPTRRVSPSPGTTVAPYRDTGTAPDGRADGEEVYLSPTLDQEAGLAPAKDSPLPASIDLGTATRPAAPMKQVEAAYVVTSDGATSAVLVGPDGGLSTLDLSPAGDFTPTPAMVSPLGTYLAFPRDGAVAVYDVAAGRWHDLDVGRRSTAYLSWQGDDLLLYPRAYRGPAPICYVDVGTCSGESNPVPPPPFGKYGNTAPYGRSRGSQSGAEALAWTGADPDAPRNSFIDVGYGQQRLVMDRPGDLCCPVATWLPDDRLVYESDGGDGRRLVAWQVGTHRFELAGTVTGLPDGAAVVSSYARWDL